MTDLLEPGQIVAGRYRIERLLAQGGMGAVYVAQHTVTLGRVALKVLTQTLTADVQKKFQLEATVAARVRSDHIVQVPDAGRDEATGRPFMVMELLEGTTLERLVEESGPLPSGQTVDYVQQVSMGLDAAHGHRDAEGKPAPIVHRDLKPENLFLARRGSGAPLVKILDYGIAKVLTDRTNVTRAGYGTPLYASYEQICGNMVSPQTDVWALGLITFFLLTGRVYWKTAHNPEANVHALFAEILHGHLDPPTARIAALGGKAPWSPSFDAWFGRTVNRGASERFSSAGEAALALRAALLGPVSARAFAGTQPTVSQFERTSIAPSSAEPPETRPSGSAALSGAGTHSPLSATPPREPSRKSRGAIVLASAGGLLLAAVGLGMFARSKSLAEPTAAAVLPSAPPPALPAASTPAATSAPPAELVPEPAPPVPVKVAPEPPRLRRPPARPASAAPVSRPSATRPASKEDPFGTR